MNRKLIPIGVLAAASLTAGFVMLNKTHGGDLQQVAAIIPIAEFKKNEPKEDPSKKIATRELASSIAQELISKNPEGPMDITGQPGVKSIKSLDPNAVAGAILEEQVQAVTQEIFGQPEITPLIAEGQDARAISLYLQARGQIIADSQASLAPYAKASVEFNETTLAALAKANRMALEGMKKLPVPKPVAFLHSEQLRLLSIQQMVFEKILDKETDPLAAAVAISLLTKVTDQFAALKQSIQNYSVENNIIF